MIYPINVCVFLLFKWVSATAVSYGRMSQKSKLFVLRAFVLWEYKRCLYTYYHLQRKILKILMGFQVIGKDICTIQKVNYFSLFSRLLKIFFYRFSYLLNNKIWK